MIYAITTIKMEEDNREEGYPPYRCIRSRTVGIFKTQEEAFEILKKNRGDLNEAGHYPLAVVEEIDMGLYPEPKLIAVFKYFHELSKWFEQRAKVPEVEEYLKSVIGFVTVG